MPSKINGWVRVVRVFARERRHVGNGVVRTMMMAADMHRAP